MIEKKKDSRGRKLRWAGKRLRRQNVVFNNKGNKSKEEQINAYPAKKKKDRSRANLGDHRGRAEADKKVRKTSNPKNSEYVGAAKKINKLRRVEKSVDGIKQKIKGSCELGSRGRPITPN